MQIALNNINFGYGEHHVLKNITAIFPSAQLTVILGPSGCGKTTLLRCLSGLEKQGNGEILVEGKKLTAQISTDYSVSMVFQDLALYQSLTVQDNITLALRSRKAKKEDIARRQKEIASELNITSLLTKKVNQISGGERQRVALARSLILNPSLLLLDEPFSNLDANIKSQLRLTLKLLLKQRATTVIMVTHDQDDAFELADNMIVMNEGEIVQQGNCVDIYNYPSSLFVANFIGNPKINVMDPKSIPQLKDLFTGSKTVGIRPENIVIGEESSALAGVKLEGTLISLNPRLPLFNHIFSTAVGMINVLSGENRLKIGDKATLVLRTESFLPFVN